MKIEAQFQIVTYEFLDNMRIFRILINGLKNIPRNTLDNILA